MSPAAPQCRPSRRFTGRRADLSMPEAKYGLTSVASTSRWSWLPIRSCRNRRNCHLGASARDLVGAGGRRSLVDRTLKEYDADRCLSWSRLAGGYTPLAYKECLQSGNAVGRLAGGHRFTEPTAGFLVERQSRRWWKKAALEPQTCVPKAKQLHRNCSFFSNAHVKVKAPLSRTLLQARNSRHN